MARRSGAECVSFEANVTNETTLKAMVEAARRRWRRIDILHYNVGMSIVGGDAPLDEITEDADWSADEALAEVWAACFCAFTFPRGCTPEVGSFSDPKVVGLPGSLFRAACWSIITSTTRQPASNCRF